MRSQNRSRLIPALRLSRVWLAAGLVTLIVSGGPVSLAQAEEPIATLRGLALDQEPKAPQMPKQSKTELREVRNYPEQPPVIPHSIRNYDIDLNNNKCMNCHSRTAVERSQALMVSVTHFMDRDGQVLSTLAPRRYFCNQCHVVQLEVKPLVANDFKDAEILGQKGN